MFLSTLSIGEKALRLWMLHGEGLPTSVEEGMSGKQISAAVKNVEAFLKSLPKVESHFCRSTSSKFYLEPTWYSFRDIHRYYTEKCQNEKKESAPWKTFLNVVKKMNLDIYTPKKDQCNKCFIHKNEAFQKRIQKKNLA
ncbi:UNVERIFIED_CONTAM: hypothetical protein RMT77_014995 [Armadillidium vulgare]